MKNLILLSVVAFLDGPGDPRHSFIDLPQDTFPPRGSQVVNTPIIDPPSVPLTGIMPGVPSPTYYWDARTPLALVGSATTMAWTGTPGTTRAAPFGDLVGMQFDKGVSIGHLQSAANITWSDKKFTVCAVNQRAADDVGTVANVLVSTRTATSGVVAWELQSTTGTGLCRLAVQTATNGAQTAATASWGQSDGPWDLCCSTYTPGGNIVGISSKRSATAVTAGPTGTYEAVSSVLAIGKGPRGASPFNHKGAVAAVWYWDDVALSEAQVRTWQNYLLGLPTLDGVVPTIETSGSFGCWIDGKIHQFANDLLPYGCGSGPSGANSCEGFFSVDTRTNLFINNRLMSAGGWGSVGADVISTSTAVSPFADGSAISTITDNSDSVAEFVYQTIGITALDAGDPVSLVIWARAVTGTAGLDFLFKEETGGGCSITENQYPAVGLTTAWSKVEVQHEILDGDCTQLTIVLAPISGAHPADYYSVTQEGSVALLAHAYIGVDAFPPIAIVTVGASRAAGGTSMEYLTSLTNLTLTATSRMQITFDLTPMTSSLTPSNAPSIYLWSAFGADYVMHTPAGYSSNTGLQILDSGWIPAIDTTYGFRLYSDWGKDIHRMYRDNVLIGEDFSTTTIPDDLDSLAYGTAAGPAHAGGVCVENLRVVH
jgi:hypothetical protein